MYAVQNYTGIKFNIVLYKNCFPWSGVGIQKAHWDKGCKWKSRLSGSSVSGWRLKVGSD